MHTTSQTVLAIPEPRLEQPTHGVWRVVAEVGGAEVFFESSTPLIPRPETFVCPFLLPAMARHLALSSSAPLPAEFVQGLAFIRKRALEWWPDLSGGDLSCPIGPEIREERHSGLFYTGGVDSSYSLQQLRGRIHYAVYVEGFDIPLKDRARLEATRKWLTATTRRCGVELIVVRTNLREHAVFNSITWVVTHVAALAGVAYALGEHVDRMYVAASDVPPPHGSSPEMDNAWSSEFVRISNFSAELSRLQRVASIADWEPLRGRLRVCWENNSADLNCGFCEKCLRSRLQLHVCGATDGLDSFPAEQYPLLSTLRQLKSTSHHLRGQWREIARRLRDAEMGIEVDRLLKE